MVEKGSFIGEAPANPPQVLVVDDDPDVRDMLSLAVRRAGIACHAARDADLVQHARNRPKDQDPEQGLTAVWSIRWSLMPEIR